MQDNEEQDVEPIDETPANVTEDPAPEIQWPNNGPEEIPGV